MEKQETEKDEESGNGHGKRKRPWPDQYFVQLNFWFMTELDACMYMCAVVQSTLRIADPLVHRPLSFIRRVSFIEVLGLYHLQFML